MVWSGVASAAGPDARRRDEGDAGAHRGEAARLSAAAVALRPADENSQKAAGPRSGRRTSRPPFAQRTPAADSQTRHPHPFFSSLLETHLPRSQTAQRAFRRPPTRWKGSVGPAASQLHAPALLPPHLTGM